MNERADEGGDMDEGTEIARRAAKAWLDQNELVPLVLIALELGEPVDLVAEHLRDAVGLDDVGMRVVPAAAARQFFFERAEQTARMEDQARRLEEAHEPTPVAVGVPALENGSPMASLVAADSSYVSPSEEFGGRPKPNFLQDEIAEGERRLAAARAEAEARKADR